MLVGTPATDAEQNPIGRVRPSRGLAPQGEQWEIVQEWCRYRRRTTVELGSGLISRDRMAHYLTEDACDQLRWQYEHHYLIPKRYLLEKDASGQWCLLVSGMTLRLLPEAIEIRFGKSDAPGKIVVPQSLEGDLVRAGDAREPRLTLMGCEAVQLSCETVDEMDWLASLLSRLYGIPYDKKSRWYQSRGLRSPDNQLLMALVLALFTVIALAIAALVGDLL